MSNIQSHKPIEVKITSVVAVSVILHESNLQILEQALQELTGGSPDYFENECAVIDIGAASLIVEKIDWIQLVALLKMYKLNAVSVRNAPPKLVPEIVAAGLSVDTVFGTPIGENQQLQTINEEPVKEQAVPVATQTIIIDTPVRAGQRIYARNADLIVTDIVNSGAEIIADGSIHVYAPLRGRALAGASGNKDARIFAVKMEAELVSIAGIYSTFQNGFSSPMFNQPIQVRLVEDSIELVSAKIN